MELTSQDQALLDGAQGEGARMAMTIVVEAARMLGADRLVPIVSAHIDGCLYHGPAGLAFAERLVQGGARVAVPATTNVGAFDLLKPGGTRLSEGERKRAYAQAVAYERMGCVPSWTCAPYQAGARNSKSLYVDCIFLQLTPPG